jgi:hypothetical protein
VSAPAADEPSRRVKLGAFSWGFITAAVIVAVGVALIAWATALAKAPYYDVQLVTVGDDITRAGARRVVLFADFGTVTCNDACDDLWMNWRSPDTVVDVKVLDAKGACLACSEPQYVTHGLLYRMKVAGRPGLKIVPSFLNQKADGSWEE